MMTDEQVRLRKKAARDLLDRLFQDLATTLLPVLESDIPFDVRVDHGKERDPCKPIKLSITTHLNR